MIDSMVEKEILFINNDINSRLRDYENPNRIAFSIRYPLFKKPIIKTRCLLKNIYNFFDFQSNCKVKENFFTNVVTRHQSVLRRKLGDSDERLQEQKIINLRQALKKLNGLVIKPNAVFSFWKIVGKPDYKNGYVDGMLLSNGKIIEGVGGGLCQLSNFLYWIFLHATFETVERCHHSMDVFPDSSRTLPFGGGATVLYNFIDLKVKNVSQHSLQLKIWLTDKHLKGQILSNGRIVHKYHLLEEDHYFIKRGELYFRYNNIYREIRSKGGLIKKEKLTTNFAPVLYPVTTKYLNDNNFVVLDFTKEIKKRSNQN